MQHWVLGLTSALLLAGCGESAPGDPASAGTESGASTPTSQPSALPSGEDLAAGAAGLVARAKVNLNTATREQFLALPEVTAKMAHEFDEYRPYASIRQFRREISKYVDDAQVARYEQFVYVPIAVNECDAETLRQIPGLDAAGAEAIIAGRPYADNAAFLAALGDHVGAAAVETARAYVSE